MNTQWHRRHVLPKNASLEERISWHREHQEACACRPIPPKLLAQMRAASGQKSRKAAKPAKPPADDAAVDPRFAPVVDAFARRSEVTYGGKGFGSSALKVNGKIFAMMTPDGTFVAKLPRARVDELVRLGKGEAFDPGHGRVMKEWIALREAPATWLDLAREAHRFVGGGPSSK